jgi:hypothetical protein
VTFRYRLRSFALGFAIGVVALSGLLSGRTSLVLVYGIGDAGRRQIRPG